MARNINKLSALKVKGALAPKRHSDGGGLYLSVSKTGTKSWVFMWVDGKRTEMGLGPYPAISLADARTKAEECRRHVAQGKNPKSERDRLTEKTFGECALEYIEVKRPGWRNPKSQAQWKSSLTTYCTNIWDRPVSTIELADVLSALQPIWNEIGETAKRVRGRIENILDYAKTKGWRQGENPARWKGSLENILPKQQKLQRGRMASMPYVEVPEFIAKLQTSEAMSARALEFLILTAGRSGEVRGATWDEIDIEAKIWTILAERMKAGTEHRVPLSDRAIEILKPLKEAQVSEYVFPGHKLNRALSDMTLTKLLKRWKIEKTTVHGFRSSFRDWCGEENEFDRESVELSLAHKIGNAAEQAYRRRDSLEKRRKIMDAWEQYCLS